MALSRPYPTEGMLPIFKQRNYWRQAPWLMLMEGSTTCVIAAGAKHRGFASVVLAFQHAYLRPARRHGRLQELKAFQYAAPKVQSNIMQSTRPNLCYEHVWCITE